MPPTPTAEDKALRILAVFAHLGCRPDEALGINKFLWIFVQNEWPVADIRTGGQKAADLGWIRQEGANWFLTEAGQEAIDRSSAATR